MKVFSPSKLKLQRKASGYTQRSLGESIGTTERHVQYWEAGSKLPTATYLLRMMVLLNASAQDLLEDEAV